MGESEFQHGRVRGRLMHVHERHPGRDDPHAAIAFYDAVQRARFVPGGDFGQLAAQATMCGPRIHRNHHAAADVALEMCRPGRLRRRMRLDERLRMAHARGHAQQHGQMPPGRGFQCGQREVVGLLRIGRFEHRHAGSHSVAATVLLVLAGGHSRIVGRDDDQRPIHAGVRGREERIGRDVHPHVLHGHQRRRRAKSHAQGHFERHLLVRRPLCPAPKGVKVFEDFGRGRAGIAGRQRNARIVRAPGPRPYCR